MERSDLDTLVTAICSTKENATECRSPLRFIINRKTNEIWKKSQHPRLRWSTGSGQSEQQKREGKEASLSLVFQESKVIDNFGLPWPMADPCQQLTIDNTFHPPLRKKPKMGHQDHYAELLSCLPLDTVDYAFAYGSGALKQKDENTSDKMVDFILATNDPVAFHRENLAKNSSHYSLIRLGGSRWVAKFQTTSGARIFYNTHVNVGSRLIKYGVISIEDLKSDLLDWNWLYVAGRLQKPVLEVVRPPHPISEAVRENRRSALQAALLLLPDQFSIEELYRQIVALSYTGDFRMTIGEDKNKVKKIVGGSIEELHGIYRPLLGEDSRLTFLPGDKILQDASTPAIYHRLNLLPSTVLRKLQSRWNKRIARQIDNEEVLFSLAHRHDISQHISASISSIVAPVALSQTLKNAVSAGVARSIVYSIAKMSKMLKSVSV